MSELTTAKCECGGNLFLNWGLEIMVQPKDWEITMSGAESSHKGKVQSHWLHFCAFCKRPYYMEENHLIDATELVSAEEVTNALNALQAGPLAKRAKTIDP